MKKLLFVGTAALVAVIVKGKKSPDTAARADRFGSWLLGEPPGPGVSSNYG